jgi:hypothetical protein
MNDQNETMINPAQVWTKIVRILPEDLLSQGIQIKETISDLRWSMGWYAISVYDHVVKNSLPYTKAQVAAAIAHFFDDVRGMSSILVYMHVAEFYPPEIVEAYDILPFSHFEYAMRFNDDWRRILDRSLELAGQNGGMPPSLKRLEAEFDFDRLSKIHYEAGSPSSYADLTDPEKGSFSATGTDPDLQDPDRDLLIIRSRFSDMARTFYADIEPKAKEITPDATPILDRLKKDFEDLFQVWGMKIKDVIKRNE